MLNDLKASTDDAPASRGLWVVATCFNESDVITKFIDSVLRYPEVDHLVLVDDGSTDQTVNKVRDWIEGSNKIPRVDGNEQSRLTLIELTRNFGKESAMLAGLDYVRDRCQAVILMDSDMQHPPELIPSMVTHWKNGAEMITAIRSSKDQESAIKVLAASGFYALFNKLVSSVDLIDGAGDFRLLSKPVVLAMTDMREGIRFSKALFPWTGFHSVNVLYDRPLRSGGTSSWNIKSLAGYALNAIFDFSMVPLRIWTFVGVVFSCGSFLYALFLVLRVAIHGVDVPGYTSLIVAILMLGGIQLIGIGILGEYLGRVYAESKRRPPYLVRCIRAPFSS